MVVIAFPATNHSIREEVLLAPLTTIQGILRYPFLCVVSWVLLLLLLQLELHESLLLLN